MRRFILIENLVSLVERKVITFEKLKDFSDELKESVQVWMSE